MSTNRNEQDTHVIVVRLQKALESCSKVAGDYSEIERSISEVVDLLNPIADEGEDEDAAFQILTHIHHYLTSSSSLDQPVIDALSFELPKAVAKFACASKRCFELSVLVIHHFIETCNPRDMLSILCEALGAPSQMFRVPDYFSCLLFGTSKVLVNIRRRHFEQVKASVPVILNVLKAMALDLEDEDTDCEDLLYRSIDIAQSVKEICVKLEGEESKRTRALFSLFILQTMALVTIGMRNKVSSCLPLVLQLSHFLRHCNLSYTDLITGKYVDMMANMVLKDDGDEDMSCFSHVKHGSSLAVIWGYMSNEVAAAAEVDFGTVIDELQRDQDKRWQAIGALKLIFSSINIPWEQKTHAINFLLSIVDQNASPRSEDECHDYSIYMPSHYSSLQAILMVIMYAPDAGLRKNSFEAFKRVLSDVRPSPRFEILSALVKNSDSSSMIAILLHRIKEEMLAENSSRVSSEVLLEGKKASQTKTFWNTATLELVQLVLRPPKGGPPDLPEHSDAVLSALNLYRFILITETTGDERSR